LENESEPLGILGGKKIVLHLSKERRNELGEECEHPSKLKNEMNGS
jgi:hypothetical protein